MEYHNCFYSKTTELVGKCLTTIFMEHPNIYITLQKQAQRRAAMDRRMQYIIPNESYNINHNV